MSATILQPVSHGSTGSNAGRALAERVRGYWSAQVHDANVSESPAGSDQFFRDLDAYRRHKLDYVQRIIDFSAYADRDVLEIGCGAGFDLARFAREGARATGVDVSSVAIDLARRRFGAANESASLLVADGSTLPFPDQSFDFIYCHGVLPYVADPEAVLREAYRVLRIGGAAVFMAYHRRSWLNALRWLGSVELAHADAPVLRTETRAGFRASVSAFQSCTIVTERFPVATRLHGNWRASAFNHVFVPLWRLIPNALVRPLGWHLLAFCRRLD